MSVLRAQNLTKLFLLDIVFSDLSFEVAAGDRVAIVGPNGCGKSTLLKIVAGLEPADSGAVHRARGLRIGYQPQEARFDAGPGLTLRGAMRDAFADVIALEGRLAELQAAMATEQGEALERLLAEYAELEHTFELRGGYDYDLRIERVLAGLGFERDDFDLPCDHLSGGQRTRAALGRVLLGAPDLLLLDEPTNHLDITAREWLENFLADWPGSLIVVAHDRFFLDKVCNQVWDMEYGRLERYPGNYTKYESLREARRERLMAEFEAQQREIAKTEEFIRRYKNSQKSREARGREKRLNRLERLRRPETLEKIRLDLKGALRSGDLVLATDRLEVGYRDRDPATGELQESVLLRCPDLVIRREDRVALVGPNGTGKTTLLKTVVGQLWPLRGEVSIGPSVHVGYYAQAHEGLNADATVLQEILGAAADLTDGPARNFLGKYLFSGEDVFKRVGDLSGGERSRVALAKLELAGANWLILDEPTNHLDIRSQATLQDVLTDYDGTILFVSHDRWFIDALATQIWSVEDGTVRVFQGTYSEWQRYRREQEQEAQRAAQDASAAAKPGARAAQNGRAVGGPSEKECRRELERIEREIAALEARQTELEGLLATPAEGDGLEAARRIGEWGREHAEVSIRLDGLMTRWGEVAETLEAVQVRG